MGGTGPEVLLVRHGQTEWSLSRQHTGTTEVPLTDEGRRQGELLGRRLAGRRFERVLCSPLGRARETYRLADLSEEAQLRDDLREWDYGRYEGRSTADVRTEQPGWYLWTDGAPEGEKADDVGERVDRVIAELRELDGDAAVFAHGHVLRVLAARWLELPAAAGGHFGLDTATLSVLGWEHEFAAMWLWNDDAHLRDDD